ncbi:PTS lactose/cellobiose transporter subunit IIA [Companilactobacillus zhachilii]|jgi:Phosphotransferase system cellobiose-specific component IIA|uniref:PTS lactose/cellobiose transporter subunit IIA n=1 Tax=Companilactobacillus zhachilii TaxID=2304606 RepID=A0A386PP12_9LACO|nr:PTS lactose/cellobiose transporter subunit IIA [Companilactobacillus zhachilii]AYE37266.1 PTS lactose/cellobiose transporter subunit IIA [Companilactobacillus zhachilii]
MEDLEQQIFEIITHSGTARSTFYDALKIAREGNIEKAHSLMSEGDHELTQAHNVQTKLITADMSGKTKISLLLIHAQDQFMTTMSEQTLIEQMISMQAEINELKNK